MIGSRLFFQRLVRPLQGDRHRDRRDHGAEYAGNHFMQQVVRVRRHRFGGHGSGSFSLDQKSDALGDPQLPGSTPGRPDS